jgi:hypothetical protein
MVRTFLFSYPSFLNAEVQEGQRIMLITGIIFAAIAILCAGDRMGAKLWALIVFAVLFTGGVLMLPLWCWVSYEIYRQRKLSKIQKAVDEAA